MLEIIIENKYREQLNLSEMNGYNVTVTGLTPPDATINTSVIVTKDGSTFNSSRLNERNIVLQIVPNHDIEHKRINLYKYIKSKQYIKLYLKNSSRDVWIEGYVEKVEGDLYTQKQVIQVSIICPDPYFKSIETLEYEFSTVESMFSFPFSIEEPVPISSVSTFTEKNIENISDEETGIVIELYANGLSLEPTIYNMTTNESFTIQHEFEPGDIVRINTRRGEKSLILIRDGEEINIINKIVRGSKWFNLIVGDNIFSYTSIYGTENLQVKISLQPIYEGV